MPAIEKISAVTLATHDMPGAVGFYQALGFHLVKGGAGAEFTTLEAGTSSLNLVAADPETRWAWWGRVIFHVSDVDTFHEAATAAGIVPDFTPRDAPWGERYFHVTDPDGHQISFATPLER